MANQIAISLPAETLDAKPSEQTGITVSSAGTGSFSGVNWNISAHTKGKVQVDLQIKSLTSADVEDINKLVMSMLSASERSKVEKHSKASASGSISFFELICGGAKAGAETTKDSMHSMGLTDEQISTIIDKVFTLAQKMSDIKVDLEVDNTAFDYPVAGDLDIYTIGGEVTADKKTRNFRFLADKGTVGDNVPTKVKANLP